jgi:hypothetical protein
MEEVKTYSKAYASISKHESYTKKISDFIVAKARGKVIIT